MMLLNTGFWLAQIPISQSAYSPEMTGLMFLSPQFFISLIAGLLMAFSFQFVLTNFLVAAKASDWDQAVESDDDDDDIDETFGSKAKKLGATLGAVVLLTVNIAVFAACFLAVKLTAISSVGTGAIIGVVIWSAYFLGLFWMSSTAVGSLVGSIINTATSGIKGIMGTATAAMSGKAVSDQIVNTVEASVSSVRRELDGFIDPANVRDKMHDYVQALQLPELDIKQIRSDFEKLLNSDDVKEIISSDALSNVNRQKFIDLVSSRTNFGKKEIEGIVDQLEGAWKQVGKQQPQQLIPKGRDNGGAIEPQEVLAQSGKQLDESMGGGQNRQEQKEPGLMERAMQVGGGALMTAVAKKVNIPNVDVEQVTEQLQKLGSQVVNKLPSLPENTIKGDIENYLLQSKPWHLNRETIKQEFREVIYDPDAAPSLVSSQLEGLNRDYFVDLLKRRTDFDEQRVNEVADQLQDILNDVSTTVKTADTQEQSQDLQSRIQEYLRSTGKEELNPEGIERDFTALLEDPQAGFEALKGRFSQFDRDTLVQLLGQRQDFSPEEAEQLISKLEETRDRVLSNAQQTQEQAKSKVQEVRQKVEEYLRNTNLEELNPEGIQRDFQTLVADPQAGFQALRDRLSQFDRETLVQLLSQRQDINEEQVNQIVDQIQSVRDNILQSPQKVADTAKEQYEQFTNKIGEYLRNTNLEELNPEGIQKDLTQLLQDPKQGALALRDRFSQLDRESLVKLLSQREGITEDQVNQTIDQVQDAISRMIKAPRSLASRAQDMVMSWEGSIENYLRNTRKTELNPDSIKRDLQLLFNHPTEGMERFRDRFSQFDRNTLVSILSQREDLTEDEANQVVDQITSFRDQFFEQVHNVQDKAQSAIDTVFGQIENYLNSLNRPELNYQGIKQDFSKLFDDQNAGFDAIKERLSHFDRDTLVAILSSRKDISEEDANRIIAQFESARDSVLERAERIQNEAKRRMKQMKAKAKQQAEDAQEAAATAAWWLFGTAVTSAITAAIAGAIAVSGISSIVDLIS